MNDQRTGADSESPDIIATCQQTRFHILEDKRSSEVSIEQLSLSIRSSQAASKVGGSIKTAKSKASTAKTHDILIDTNLRLKAGVHYGLLGRNGSGKSTLLRAIASKAIPSLSRATRIALLQQIVAEGRCNDRKVSSADPATPDHEKQTVLQHVLDSDEARNEIQAELDILTPADTTTDEHSNAVAQIRAYRRLRYSRMQKELLEMQKNAVTRSGSRGSQARKDLLKFEKQVEEFQKRYESVEQVSIDTEEAQVELAQALQMISDLQAELDERRIDDLERKALKMLSHLGFKDSMIHSPFCELSGGWQMRCMLAITLLQDADIMILDEPTNFLDLLGIIWLQKYLMKLRATSGKTVVLVSHDRDFMDKVCEEIVFIKDQSLEYFDGNISAYEEDLKSRRQNLTRMKEAQDRQRAHMEKTIAGNIKAGKKSGDDNKLRQAVSRQKRLDDRMGMQTNSRGARFRLNKDMIGYHHTCRVAIEIPPEENAVSLVFPLAPDLRFPGALVSLDHVTFSYDRKQAVILQDISLSIYMGARIGIIGLNGSGKSTLIKLVTEVISPTKGIISRHPRLKLGYYSQSAAEDLRLAGQADPSMTALSTLSAEAGDEMNEQDIRGLLSSFHLVGNIASHVPVAQLSGGQLVRLALACIVWKHPHLLVLDEVTTHLDFYTVQALSRALRQFNGALLIVAHDRFFVKSVIEGSTELLGIEEDDETDEEDDARAELQRSLYRLKKGSLTLLEHGVQDFEQSLEVRVDKLLAS